MINILPVVGSGICKGCATCVSICPAKCIDLNKDQKRGIYSVTLDESLCIFCGKCLDICPAYNLDLSIDENDPDSRSFMLGDVYKAWTGFSCEYKVRFSGTSGGIVTAILLYLLENKIINGALVTYASNIDPLTPMPLIARTRAEIIKASGSKYAPVPLNLSLNEIRGLGKDEQIAVVGLPCHITGLRRVADKDKTIDQKILFYLGLFCGQTPSFYATDYSIKAKNVDKKSITGIKYRGNGWPGKMMINLKNMPDLSFGYRSQYAMGCILSSLFFTPSHCLFCNDPSAEISDISFADAWSHKFSNDKTGRSLIIARTIKGQSLIEGLQGSGNIEIEDISVNDAISMQSKILVEKKSASALRRKLFSMETKIAFMNDIKSNKERSLILILKTLLLYPIMRIFFLSGIEEKAYNLPFIIIRMCKVLNKLR